MARVYLSPPHLAGNEGDRIDVAIAGNWIAPLGPEVDAFEAEFSERIGVGHAAALSSGTAALHLALRLLDVGPGDRVFCSDLTFAASVYPILYQGAEPVFIDCHPSSWCLDPDLLCEALRDAADADRLPAAVIVVDLYGQSADYDPISSVCAEYGVPIVEDAAEALGATYRGRPVGSFGTFGAFSFNGNKIITTSGGGMLTSTDGEAIDRARRLASQARDPAPHYQHSELGYNYRLSNLLAALGRAQLAVLDDRIRARRRNFAAYSEALAELPGIEFMPEASYGEATRWLTCLTIDPEAFGRDRETIRHALEALDIESRPVWKPMHQQPLFSGARVVGGEIGAHLFEHGLCLPSGSNLDSGDRARVIETVHGLCRQR